MLLVYNSIVVIVVVVVVVDISGGGGGNYTPDPRSTHQQILSEPKKSRSL
jgi:hypothetical protein